MSPRVRKGKVGPKKSMGGMPGTNKKAKAPKGSSGSSKSHERELKDGGKKSGGY